MDTVQDGNIPASTDFTQNGATDLDNVVGFLFTGGLLYNPV